MGLITFSSGVTIEGDGMTKAAALACSLNNFELIESEAEKFSKWFSKTIDKSYDKLKEVVEGKTANGSTALGPALLTATKLASMGSVGSKVIICTDGEANTGIGAMGDTTFYDRMGEYAKSKKVTISVLTIKGASCNVKMLGKVTNSTGGTIMKVDPTKLGT